MACQPVTDAAAADMKSARLTYLSAEDYLAFEHASDVKHEYVAGHVFAMVGARDAHNTVALNIASRLKERLRGGPCRVFISDMKLRVEAADAFYYPDVFVSCDPRDSEPYFKRFPCLVVEVLSPTTEAVDKREKLRHYRMLDTLREYVLVSPELKTVEICRREPTGEWTTYSLGADDPVDFTSVTVRLSFEEVFEGVAG